MSFGAEVVARTLGLSDVPVRAVRRAGACLLLVTAVTMPITFRHGLVLFADREAQQIVQRFVDPLIKQVQQQSPPAPAHAPPTDSSRQP